MERRHSRAPFGDVAVLRCPRLFIGTLDGNFEY